MEQKIIKISLGLSLPITMLVGYVSYHVGNIVGKYEAYKDVAKNESKDNDSDK